MPFNFYDDSARVLLGLSDEDAGKIVRAIMRANLEGVEPEFDTLTMAVYTLLKGQIDRAEKTEFRNGLEYKKWRLAVFERDCFTCQSCGKSGGKLNAHHIERYRSNIERRTDINNGITLCEKCHRELHKEEGR